MRVDSLAHGGRGRGIPVVLNLSLAAFHILLNFYQFIFLPVVLLPINPAWGWTLVPAAFLTNPFWSLIHEAIHDLFHPQRTVNAFFGRLLAILFGAPLRILRASHLVHHKLNRLPIEGTELYDRASMTKARAAPGYYFQIFFGLYAAEVLSPLYFLLPQKLLVRLQKRLLKPDSVSAILMQNWLGPAALREIRFDGCLAMLWLGLGAACYGRLWPLFAAALLARGLLISFLDNVYHYGTPVGNIFYARNLSLAPPAAKLLLHFNLHGVHHVNPAIPWSDLPEAFEAEGGRHEGRYLAAALNQLRGPIALQDLPEGAPVVRIRPF